MKEIDLYFLNQEDPNKSCLLYLRECILDFNSEITEAWKYKMPFYSVRGKMFCYLWVHKKCRMPYIGFVEGSALSHPDLLIEKRARMKILLIDPSKDIPVKKINALLKEAITLYLSFKPLPSFRQNS